jgi:glutathione synthase/RimK-type ligase-like ATP-grasp enzyme
MRHNGLPTPLVHEIRSDADVEPAARRVGFPAVLKPVSGEPRGGW